MNKNELWNKFLFNIKEVISSTSFDIWFNENDTKLYSFENDIATITVTQEFYKKHLEEHYMDNILGPKEQVRLSAGDIITIGATTMIFHLNETHRYHSFLY